MAESPCILFTAFEPSGDEHAAPVIRQLRAAAPDVPVYALGGPKMREAGAQIIDQTTGNAAMLAGAAAKVVEQYRLRRRLARWLDEHRVAVHVPTDSPAANWGICRMMKARGAKVVHLVAPQVWAWASWRVARLRRWSDLVLCVLPFEPQWLEPRGVEARFVGHPLFDESPGARRTAEATVTLAEGPPRIALLPGSRPSEVAANWPIVSETAARLAKRYPLMAASVAVAGPDAAAQIQRLTPSVPEWMNFAPSRMDAVLEWADVALTVSGTATLHVARHRKPMAVLYRVNLVTWHILGRWLIHTRTFALPNLISGGGPNASPDEHIVREFVPFLSGPASVEPIVEELSTLIEDDEKRRRQIAALEQVARAFTGHDCGREAAQAIIAMMRDR